MRDALIFYTHPMSRGRLTRWMLEETGLPYQEVLLEYDGSMKGEAYLAINPMGKVPALVHGDTVITENVAICAYLADLVPERQLAPPPGSKARGSYYRWLAFLAGPVEAVLTAKQSGAFAPARSAGYGTEADVLRTLEQALSAGPHLVGEAFTAADLYATGCLGYYLAFNMIEPRPAFAAFAQRHATRPAALRAAARDDALLQALPVRSAV